jgi:hypothetical protein
MMMGLKRYFNYKPNMRDEAGQPVMCREAFYVASEVNAILQQLRELADNPHESKICALLEYTDMLPKYLEEIIRDLVKTHRSIRTIISGSKKETSCATKAEEGNRKVTKDVMDESEFWNG